MSKTLEISDVEIESTEGGFEGKGTREGGETVSFTVTLLPAESKLEYVSEGDRGFIQNGDIVIE